VGKWHLGYEEKFHPMSRGFDEFFGFLGGGHSYLDWAQGQPVMRGREPVSEQTYLTDAFGREAVAFVERHKGRPFFLYLAFNAVHTPMDATEKYLGRFKGIQDPRRRTYAAMTSAMDDAVGEVLAKLRESGLEERTLIFYVSDNGGPPANASNNAPLRGNKAQTLEGGVRVPFFVQWKGRLPGGRTYDRPVIQLDVCTTALAAAGATTPKDSAKLDGVNLLPYLKGEKAGDPHEALYWRFGKQTAVRAGDWKLVRHRQSTSAELYDLSDDVGESKDLAAARPKKVKELQALWDKWNAELSPPKWGEPAGRRQQRRQPAS
jgi:arylsulfatase A-like enzyme